MNVAILLLNRGRGSGEVARQHARYLIKQGHAVSFIHPGVSGEIEGAENVDVKLHTDVIPVHEYLPSAGDKQQQVARMTHQQMMAYLPDYEAALEKIATETDIFIGHHANLSAVAVRNIAQKYHKPFVLFVHGTGIEPRHMNHWDDKNWELIIEAIKQAKGIIVTTEYVRDKLIKPLIPLPDDRFLILPCGVDLHDFKPGNYGDVREKYRLPEKYVICPGALTFSKGPQNVVEASKEYAGLAKTVFIGDGELREELVRNLGDRGMFLGYVSETDKAHLINAAELLVAAPEKKEHFGIIYAEALAGGTPPVAYEGGGVGSIITKDTGCLTSRSPEMLGLKTAELLGQPELISEMSIAGRKRAEELYDYNKLVKKLAVWLSQWL